MTDSQKMFDDSLAPAATHCDDVVECSDGSECPRNEAFEDCVGKFHRTEKERHEADVMAVTEELDERAEWCEDYCTGNEDYAESYICIVSKSSHEWSRDIEEWIFQSNDDIVGPVDLADIDGLVDSLVSYVREELDADFDCEIVPNHSDYGGYSGSGCCLGCFKIEEYEEQIDVNDCDVLHILHEQGRLDDVLDDYNGAAYVCRSRRREKSEETGHYEDVGRATYDPYPHHEFGPAFCINVSCSGGWDFVVPSERMTELVCEAVVKWFGYEIE